MRNMKIHVGQDGPKISVRETEDTGAWELEWTGDMGPRHARRMMQTAETIVLRNGGERIVLTCRAEQEALRAELDRWPPTTVSRSGDRYQLDIVVPAKDGFMHDDDDFRTPLARITCPTCVDRIARSRTKKREEALGKGNGPKEIARHTRLIAGAYARLAEIEENLEIRTAPPHPE